jgi:hypothetical protein
MASTKTTTRTIRIRRSLLAALDAAAAEAGVSPNKMAGALLHDMLARWLAQHASAGAIPGRTGDSRARG